MEINLTRYSEDASCIEPEGLRAKLLADLLPTVRRMGLQRNRCIVATYVRPSVTKGGIILTNRTQEEDRWQGKAGLLIAVGPSAFDFEEVRAAVADAMMAADEDAASQGVELTDDERNSITLHAMKSMNVPEIGDWVAYRTSETHEVGVPVQGEHTLASCRFITDDAIVMRVDDPRLVY
jgi:co-chaperonin GroES (HSP10)